MSNDTKVQDQDLKKLEDEAYFELRQIIAEAMQLQDVELLDSRIASWKTKYRKLLDRPSTSSRSDFKKRIEFLLNDYYSSITQYILDKLRLKEEKKIENQAKAMRELHHIIKNTNDYDLLKKKVNKWQEKYPIASFLRMYQKRIELYTRDKNLRDNSFKQEEAFSDLVDITKKHASLDELNIMVEDWEKKYSINDKYSIDDFLKHQSEVKRFISDEFLQSIAREDRIIDNAEKSEIDVVSEYNNKSFSNLSIQASSYAALLTISKSPNNINEMFKWVYENRHVKFNDKYKELILSATYLDYSPTYLNKLSRPDMDMSKSSLSYDEYNNISDIKRYAIISYFNLLLPPEKAISNDYFNKHIQTIYSKSEKARTTNHIEDETSLINELLDSGIEIPLENPDNESSSLHIDEVDILDTTSISEVTDEKKVKNTTESPIEGSLLKTDVIIDLSNVEDVLSSNSEVLSKDKSEVIVEKNIDIELPEQSGPIAKKDVDIELPEQGISSSNLSFEEPKIEVQAEVTSNIPFEKESEINVDIDPSIESFNIEATTQETKVTDTEKDVLNYDTVVAFSPLFFEAINNFDNQVVLVNHIDSSVTKYIETEKANTLEFDNQIKTKDDLD